MADILFIALAFFAITGAIAMLVYKSPMFSALGLLITMLSVAGMFALLNATLLFMVQIIVYAGAIMALILFILMFLNIKEGDFGTIKPVGLILYNDWIIAFELISILLLIALVGSVVLAKRRKTKITSKED